MAASNAIDLHVDYDALAAEIWWDESFEIGATEFHGRVQPDRFAAKGIIDAVLKRAGFLELVEALKPFADLGVGSGPDDEHDLAAYRLTRGSIRNARAALSKAARS